MQHLYFAYGSNMNAEQMRRRVPNARRVGVGRVDGFTVAERLYANLERSATGTAYGVVYAVDDEGMRTLDRYEGYPRTYGCAAMVVDAKVYGEGAWRPVRCLVYTMTAAARWRRYGLGYPDDYRERCSVGARENGLPDAFAARRRVAG